MSRSSLQLFESIAQTRQRRAQIVGDVVGYVADAIHQAFDFIDHAVQVAGQLIELVAAAANRDALRQVAGHDVAAGLVDDFDAA